MNEQTKDRANVGETVAVLGDLEPRWRHRLLRSGTVRVVTVPAGEPIPEETTVLAGTGLRPRMAAIERLRRLRWVHVFAVGVDGVVEHLPAGVTLTNSAGFNADTVAEHALALLLAVRRIAANPPTAPRSALHPIPPLAGDRHLIIGFGHIGQALGRMSEALGMTVRGVRTRPDPSDPRQVGLAQLEGELAQADVITLACALTPATRRLMNRERIARLKPTAVMVNIARAGVIDQDALLEALAGEAIFGAGLDVTEPEPLPTDHPLLTLPRVVVTPHVAGNLPDYRERTLAQFAQNLDRYLAGKPLLWQVDRTHGY